MMDLERRLDRLREAGLQVFDGPGLRFVETLLLRAATLTPVEARRIHARADERLQTLEESFRAANEEAVALLTEVLTLGADPEGRFENAISMGDFSLVKNEAPRLLTRLRSGLDVAARARVQRLIDQADTKGAELAPELRDAARRLLDAPGPIGASAREVGDALGRAMYRDAAEHARTTVVVARAHDRLSRDHGPYNAEAIAAQVLSRFETLSPAYLRVMVGWLEDLSILRHLPEPKRRR